MFFITTVYDIFKNFDEIRTQDFIIAQEEFKIQEAILFRVYKKDENNNFKYLGLSYIKSDSLHINIEDVSSYYDRSQRKNLIEIHPSATLFPYHRVIELLLTTYLKNKIRMYYDEKDKQRNLKKST